MKRKHLIIGTIIFMISPIIILPILWGKEAFILSGFFMTVTIPIGVIVLLFLHGYSSEKRIQSKKTGSTNSVVSATLSGILYTIGYVGLFGISIAFFGNGLILPILGFLIHNFYLNRK